MKTWVIMDALGRRDAGEGVISTMAWTGFHYC